MAAKGIAVSGLVDALNRTSCGARTGSTPGAPRRSARDVLDALLTKRALFWRLGFIPLAIGVGIAGDGLWFK